MSVLFTPFKVGSLEIKNRFVMCAMNGVRLYSMNGTPPEDSYDFYLKRAVSGIGLIVTRAVMLHPIGTTMRPYDHPEYFAVLRPFTESVHKCGAKIFMQVSAGIGRNFNLSLESLKERHLDPYDVFVAPSDGVPNVWRPEIKHRGLSRNEIHQLTLGFAKISRIVKDVGFDGVEVHAVHEGYLLDQFTIGATNTRTDEYGGSLSNRFRFPCEIVQAIKEACGRDFPVSIRYSVTSKMKSFGEGLLPGESGKDFGRDIQEGIAGAKLLEQAGYDMLNVDNGAYDSPYWPHPPTYMPEACNLVEAAEVKRHVNIPVVCAGKMDVVENEDFVASGKCDGIGLARALLADPEYVIKLRQGSYDSIRPCINCHAGCFGSLESNGKIGCALNVQVLKERWYSHLPYPCKKKVIVVGGGVAGMEAAIVCRSRGHQVEIYEQSDHLGGIFVTASSFSFKLREQKLLDWFKGEIKRLSIPVWYNRAISAHELSSLSCDLIILATGASYALPRCAPNGAVSAVDFIDMNQDVRGKNILICGGGLTGCEIAYDVVSRGGRVTIIEKEQKILSSAGIPSPNRAFLIDALKKGRVSVMTSSVLGDVTDGVASVVNWHERGKAVIQYDTLVLATGAVPNAQWDGVKDSLDRESRRLYRIGDADHVGNIMSAIASADEVAYSV